MEEKLLNLKNQAISSILDAKSKEELENLRIYYLGRKGTITELVKQIPFLPLEKRKDVGRMANEVKNAVEETIERAGKQLDEAKNAGNWLDVTAPGIKPSGGHLHLVTQTIEEITNIFSRIGFNRIAYPEVDWDWYAFEGLNMPKEHPARDEWETFFVEGLKNPKFGQAVLTPHTSSGQLREMERVKKPPIRMLNIAKCYRRQSDISHAPMFYQFEGLVIDKGINITHLKGTLDYFVKQYFGPKREARIRPFHFQFTEPSFEVDVTCMICEGKGCKVCKEGWLELGGSGMVHPNVLRNGGIDPQKYTGFAWGWGVERVMMMKYGIPDIRLLFSGDLRFLNQF
ncbi:MAG: phenylalanine--tRNA ligase subunit alpha [bacterium]|nr:phenylalanine--tRNA ligase subunit alpha [bacterium]